MPSAANGISYTQGFTLSQPTTVNYAAVDVAGTFGTVQTQSVNVDTQAPTGVSIISPLDGGTYSASGGYINIQPNPSATDNVGIWGYAYYRDCNASCEQGTLLGNRVNTPSRWSWYWDAGGGLQKGTHTLCIKAYDDAGNSTWSGPVYVNLQ
jgi:hypothetical protein